jgi:glycosyltransferase involved in cell wall biosynthesis
MGKSICLATVDFEGLVTVGGIGSYYHELAKLLSQNGWDVVVLFHPYEGGDISKFAEKYYETYNIPIYNANELCEESAETLHEIWRDAHWCQARSHIFHEALQVLMKKYGYAFDLIEFPEWGGAGFIPLQMNKNFKNYKDSKIIVKLHGSWKWHTEGCGQEWLSFDDLKLNYLEQYAFENADIQVSPTYHLLEWYREHGWMVRPDASICRYPLRLNFKDELPKNLTERKEIIFFGRFEERKGVIEFIEALHYIKSIFPSFPSEYSITFIGKEDRLSKSYIIDNLDGYESNFFTSTRDKAITYLAENARLVVIPSRLDNFPNTVLECMYAKIPFVTSRSGGIPEMLGVGSELYTSISCDIYNPRNLGDLILEYLKYDEDHVQKLLNLAHQRVKEITDPEKIVQWYSEKACENQKSLNNNRKEMSSRVTIIIPTRNLPAKYLEATLRSLLNQTYKNIKIIIKDSSTEPKAILTLGYLDKKYPNVIVIHKEDTGVGNALNQALSYVDTKYVMQVDGDNIAKPDMVATFVKCMENRDDVVALSSYFAAFRGDDEEKVLKLKRNNHKEKYIPHHYYKPIGPCLPPLFFENVQGDANSIFSTDIIKSVGGWPEDRKGFPDWGMWIKLLANSYNIDVIPKVLFYYRDHPESDAKTKKLFYIDNTNIQFARTIIENRPEFFSSNCYEDLHRLIRRPTADFNGIPAMQELSLIKKSTLYAMGVKLGDLAVRSPKFKSLLELTGKIAKKMIGVKE